VAGKTNSEWYPFETLGGFFKLEEGVLMECPMNIDGSRSDSPYEVDRRAAGENDFNPSEIVRELEKKP